MPKENSSRLSCGFITDDKLGDNGPSPGHNSQLPERATIMKGIIWPLLLASLLVGCRRELAVSPFEASEDWAVLPSESPQDLLVSAIQEVEELADWSGPARFTGRRILSKSEAETTYVYGELTSDGYGAVVTERHTYPKGIPLITVRKSHGNSGGRIISEVYRFISLQTFQQNTPAQSSITELLALSQDTILTLVRRNGVLETYTFRLPVVTSSVGATPAETRRLTRFARGGAIVVETRDGDGLLLQSRENSALPDGSLVTRTDYPDLSWRSVRTLGQADGSILRETRSSTP
jgi:hypothetical protein